MLVFTRTKRGADKVVRALTKAGLAAEAIHGNKSQNQRERVLAAFRAGRIRTLVATDIAARGIDVEGISHVVNYDLPNIPESYVHRIGRTARAGADGVAISFCEARGAGVPARHREADPDVDPGDRPPQRSARRSRARNAEQRAANGSAEAPKPHRQQQQNRNRQHQALAEPIRSRRTGRRSSSSRPPQANGRHPAAA